jgi:hypothetical protein
MKMRKLNEKLAGRTSPSCPYESGQLGQEEKSYVEVCENRDQLGGLRLISEITQNYKIK